MKKNILNKNYKEIINTNVNKKNNYQKNYGRGKRW